MSDTKGLKYVYRSMTLDDLDVVLDIERESFLSPWTPDLFVAEFGNPRSFKRVVYCESIRRVVGYVIWWQVLDEGHLMSIAVDAGFRRKGLGDLMVRRMIEECRQHDVAEISLEVRASNYPAIELYRSFGFEPIGLRKNYYAEEKEDAVLMELKLNDEEDDDQDS